MPQGGLKQDSLPTKRSEARGLVYLLVDEERDYQDSDPHGEGHDDISLSVADWLVFIEKKLNEAKDHVYSLDSHKAMGSVRKIAALAIAAMEHKPVPSRGHEKLVKLAEEGEFEQETTKPARQGVLRCKVAINNQPEGRV